MEWVSVGAPLEFINSYPGRTIASVPDQTATSLYDFAFGEDDLSVFGSEARGLPADVVEACDVRLTIPQRGVARSLNLCVAAGMIMGEWFRQLPGGRTEKRFRLGAEELLPLVPGGRGRRDESSPIS